MEITSLLMEPSLESLKKELHNLAGKLPQGQNLSRHHQELLIKVCTLLSDLSDLKMEISNLNLKVEGVVPSSMYEQLRRLKRQTHFVGRTFLKIKTSESRSEKMSVRRNDVSTVAA